MTRVPTLRPILIFFLLLGLLVPKGVRATELSDLGLHVIPYPQEVERTGGAFALRGPVAIVIDRNAPAEDRFAAGQLARRQALQLTNRLPVAPPAAIASDEGRDIARHCRNPAFASAPADAPASAVTLAI